MRNTSQRYDSRTFLIYIDSYENNIPVGQYCNPCREEWGQFYSGTQLLLQLEQSLDIENIPQSFNKVRTFFPPTGCWLDIPAEMRPRMGKKGTFVIHVLYRRNSSWQGTVTWMEKKKTQNFRSVLELIFLLDSALMEQRHSEWHVSDEMLDEMAEMN